LREWNLLVNSGGQVVAPLATASGEIRQLTGELEKTPQAQAT